MTNQLSLMVSGIAVGISVLSLCFAWYSWRQANRPFVTARVTTNTSGNQATALDICVENTGNRPARNVILKTNNDDVLKCLADDMHGEIPNDIKQCFYKNLSIPVLANGKAVRNAFGMFSKDGKSTWKAGSVLPIIISFQDIGRRRFKQKVNLVFADDTGFAQTFWQKG